MTKNELRSFVDDILFLRKVISDKEASIGIGIFPKMHYNGETIEAGERINFGGELFRAAVTLNDTALNNPENAPVLWEKILYKRGTRIIPESITTGLKFSKNELGIWNDDVYMSLMDNNVWTPAVMPTYWKKQENISVE